METTTKRTSKAARITAHLEMVGKRIGTCQCGGPEFAAASLVSIYKNCTKCWKMTVLEDR